MKNMKAIKDYNKNFVAVIGKVIGPFQSWAEEMRRPILENMLGIRMGKVGEDPTFRSMTLAEDMRRPEDELTSKHLIGIRHKLLRNPLNVRRLSPTSDNQFDRQEQCSKPKWSVWPLNQWVPHSCGRFCHHENSINNRV